MMYFVPTPGFVDGMAFLVFHKGMWYHSLIKDAGVAMNSDGGEICTMLYIFTEGDMLVTVRLETRLLCQVAATLKYVKNEEYSTRQDWKINSARPLGRLFESSLI